LSWDGSKRSGDPAEAGLKGRRPIPLDVTCGPSAVVFQLNELSKLYKLNNFMIRYSVFDIRYSTKDGRFPAAS
jgi:hypothetical protein